MNSRPVRRLPKLAVDLWSERMSKRPVMLTHTRREVNPLDLKVSDIDPEDLAHHLSQANRFAGAPDFPISVAIHSVFVARLVRRRLFDPERNPSPELTLMSKKALICLQALIHDGSEAYLGDMTKWLKGSPAMAAYREAEDRAQRVIFEAIGVPVDQHEVVDWADRVMVRWEGLQGFGPAFKILGPDGVTDHPMYPALEAWERDYIEDIDIPLDVPWGQARHYFRKEYRAMLRLYEYYTLMEAE